MSCLLRCVALRVLMPMVLMYMRASFCVQSALVPGGAAPTPGSAEALSLGLVRHHKVGVIRNPSCLLGLSLACAMSQGKSISKQNASPYASTSCTLASFAASLPSALRSWVMLGVGALCSVGCDWRQRRSSRCD